MRSKKSLWIAVLTLGFILAASGSFASAAVVAATNYTATNNTFTSLTLGGIVYSNLTGSTANIVSGGGTNINYWITGTTPGLAGAGIANSVASGLSFREGTGNIDVGSIFQFGRVITASDYIFLSDLGTGDSFSFQLVNSSNVVQGTYTINLTPAQFGATDLIASTNYSGILNSDGSPYILTPAGQRVVAFQLADFTGTGSLATVTGIRFSAGNDTVDPSVVGLAAIPEPSVGLLGFGAVLLLLVRRRLRA